MQTKETTLSSQVKYSGKILSVKLDEVVLPDKTTAFRENVLHSGGACCLAVFEGKIAFVSQYRYSFKKDLLEIPAGKLEMGEEPEKCALRELEEEVGLKCNKLQKIASILATPGYSNEEIHIYFAENTFKGKQRLDKGEFLNVVFLDKEIAFEMLSRGEICDAKTVVALLWYKDKLNEKK